jgi:uncharacterized protein with HEPN domain
MRLPSSSAGGPSTTISATGCCAQRWSERQFEIVGESLRQLEKTAPNLAREIPELPHAVAFRNILIHGYTTVDDRMVWRTIQEDLPGLRGRLTALLDQVGGVDVDSAGIKR